MQRHDIGSTVEVRLWDDEAGEEVWQWHGILLAFRPADGLVKWSSARVLMLDGPYQGEELDRYGNDVRPFRP